MQRDGRSGFLGAGGLGLHSASCQGPALPPPHRRLPAPAPPQQARMLLGALYAPRGQALGRCLDCDRSSCLAQGGIINPGVARAGGSITPTLWMGTLRLSGCRDLVGSQGSEVAEPGGPGLACWQPTCLHCGASPHRPPEWLSFVSLETLIQMALGESLAGVLWHMGCWRGSRGLALLIFLPPCLQMIPAVCS